MKKFLVLYRAPISASEQMAKVTPEQGKQGMELWQAWGMKAAASIVDMGSPLERVASTAGPASPGHIGGFSIMQATSVDALKKTMEGHPHFRMPGGSIEIFEFLSLPGM